MTQTIDARPIAAQSPQERVDAWLADFEAALADRDIDRVVGKFATDSFWRDLVAFTWNIKTLEGPGAVAQMLTARLADTDPSGFRTREAPTEDIDGDKSSHRPSSSSRRPSAAASAICGSRATRPGRC